MEIVGESELATYLCIAGFLEPSRHLAVGAIDRGKIRAFSRTHEKHSIIPVDGNGFLNAEKIPGDSLLTLQIVNGETGIVQDIQTLKTKAEMVVLDATYSGPRIALGEDWDGAIFSPHAWGGPSGLSIFAIAKPQQWRYPLPHIAPIRTPGGYSLPLLLGAAVALENFKEDSAKISSLNRYLRTQISESIPAAIVVGENLQSLPNYQTIVIPGTISEMLVRELEATVQETNQRLRQARAVLAQLEATTREATLVTRTVRQHSERSLKDVSAIVADLAKASPQVPGIARNLEAGTATLPQVLVQTEQTALELERLLSQLRGHWLLGGAASGGEDQGAGRRQPVQVVRP
jgi:cysteine sulfinate desulfinase/cysteine desulfurase-like protein